MSIWLSLLLVLILFCFNFFSGILFNYKIYFIAKNKFLIAAIYGGISTTLFAIFLGVISLGLLTGEPIWLITLEFFALGISTYLSASLIPNINKYLKNKHNHNKTITEKSD